MSATPIRTVATLPPARTQDPITDAALPPQAPAVDAGPQRVGPVRRILRARPTGWVFVGLLLVGWQVYATVWPTPSLPSLTAIGAVWWRAIDQGGLLQAVTLTLSSMSIGFVISAVAGIVIGLVMGRVRAVYVLLEPVVELLRPVPTSALLPLLILYLGIGSEMRVAAVVISAIFPIIINAHAGARSVPPTMVETARTFGLSWLQTQREIVLPCAAPAIFIGLRMGVTISLIMSVVIGMLAGNGGIGLFIIQAQQNLNVRGMFAGIFTIALVGYLLNFVFLVIERVYLHWHVSTRETTA